MTYADGAPAVEQLRAFLPRWPVGVHLTSRGVQVSAAIDGFDVTEQALEWLRAEGVLEMQQIGATRLWRCAEAAALNGADAALSAAELIRAVTGRVPAIVLYSDSPPPSSRADEAHLSGADCRRDGPHPRSVEMARRPGA